MGSGSQSAASDLREAKRREERASSDAGRAGKRLTDRFTPGEDEFSETALTGARPQGSGGSGRSDRFRAVH